MSVFESIVVTEALRHLDAKSGAFDARVLETVAVRHIFGERAVAVLMAYERGLVKPA